MDMTMDAGIDTSSLPETYSDLEVEQLRYEHFNAQATNGGNPTATDVSIGIEPLRDKGGLDHNEIAELVAFTFDMSVQVESADNVADKADFPTRPSSLRVEGIWGANIDNSELLGAVGRGFDNSDFQSSDPTSGSVGLKAASQTEPGAFHMFTETYEEGFFNDQEGVSDADGYGGGAHASEAAYRLIYPVDMGIRGPVIDENDDLTLGVHSVKEGGDTEIEVDFRINCFWNLMEIQGVRNDFDMP